MDLIIVTPSSKINFATSYSVQGEGGGRGAQTIYGKSICPVIGVSSGGGADLIWK